MNSPRILVCLYICANSLYACIELDFFPVNDFCYFNYLTSQKNEGETFSLTDNTGNRGLEGEKLERSRMKRKKKEEEEIEKEEDE